MKLRKLECIELDIRLLGKVMRVRELEFEIALLQFEQSNGIESHSMQWSLDKCPLPFELNFSNLFR